MNTSAPHTPHDVLHCCCIGDQDLIGNKFNGHDLHLYLQKAGFDASHIVNVKHSDDVTTFVQPANHIKEYTIHLLRNQKIVEADIVHLHLIHNTPFDISYLPILSALRPVVWTLHDPWALCGHCIHPGDCEKWKRHCGDCPSLQRPLALLEDSTALRFELKKRAIREANLHVIVASDWMERLVRNSPIFQGKTIHRVPFGINQEIFKPGDRTTARRALGLEAGQIVLLARTQRDFKGLSILQDALSTLHNRQPLTVITVGQEGLLGPLPPNIHLKEYGWLKDDASLIRLYQACDMLLMPSEQEAFGMMAIEAMSCGKMVLALAGTALEDVLAPPHCGMVVQRSDYAQTLHHLLDTPTEMQAKGEASRRYAVEHYGHDRYLEKMISVYRQCIDDFKLDEDARYLLEQLRKYPEEPQLCAPPEPSLMQRGCLAVRSRGERLMAYHARLGTWQTLRAILRKML